MVKIAKERRCLKFTTYIFMPDKNDDWIKLRNYSAKLGMGRVEIFDEFNNKSVENTIAFESVGHFLNIVLKEYKKRVLKRLPTKLMKIRNSTKKTSL